MEVIHLNGKELAQDCSNDLAHGCTFHDYIDVAWQSGGAAWEVYSFSNYFGSYVAPMTIFADSVTRQVRDQLGVQRADFDLDGDVDATDIDILTAAATQGYSRVFDLNDDAQLINGTAADSDLRYMVEVELGTAFGDANLDKKVDFADFLILTTNFGEFTGWAEGDFDGDGRVLLGDFALLRLNNGFDGN